MKTGSHQNTKKWIQSSINLMHLQLNEISLHEILHQLNGLAVRGKSTLNDQTWLGIQLIRANRLSWLMFSPL